MEKEDLVMRHHGPARYLTSAATCVLLLLAFSGCPNPPAPETARAFAYVANSTSNNVSAYSINEATGALTAATGSPFTVETTPFSVAVDSSSRYLFTANYGSDDVSTFTIDDGTGALTEVSGSPVAAGTDPPFVTTTKWR